MDVALLKELSRFVARSSINISLLAERKTPSLTVGLVPRSRRLLSHSTTFNFSRKQSVQCPTKQSYRRRLRRAMMNRNLFAASDFGARRR